MWIFPFFFFSENELRAAEASKKEKEKREAEQKLNDENDNLEDDMDDLEGKAKPFSDQDTRVNGLHTHKLNDREDAIDNPKIPLMKNSKENLMVNSYLDTRLEVEVERPTDDLLRLKKVPSIDKIHFETGLWNLYSNNSDVVYIAVYNKKLSMT